MAIKELVIFKLCLSRFRQLAPRLPLRQSSALSELRRANNLSIYLLPGSIGTCQLIDTISLIEDLSYIYHGKQSSVKWLFTATIIEVLYCIACWIWWFILTHMLCCGEYHASLAILIDIWTFHNVPLYKIVQIILSGVYKQRPVKKTLRKQTLMKLLKDCC